MLKELRDRTMVITPQSAAQFSRFLSDEEARWTSLIKAKNIRIDNTSP